MTKTPLSKTHNYVLYLTKHLRLDLHDRLRMQATRRDTSIEDVLNIVLEIGLPIVEKATSDARSRKAKPLMAVEDALEDEANV